MNDNPRKSYGFYAPPGTAARIDRLRLTVGGAVLIGAIIMLLVAAKTLHG